MGGTDHVEPARAWLTAALLFLLLISPVLTAAAPVIRSEAPLLPPLTPALGEQGLDGRFLLMKGLVPAGAAPRPHCSETPRVIATTTRGSRPKAQQNSRILLPFMHLASQV